MWNEFIAQLHVVLTGLFPSRSDGQIMCQQAAVDVSRIDFDEPAFTRWFHILDESLKQESLDRLLIVASSRYPNNSALNNAMAAWSVSRQSNEVPELAVSDVQQRAVVKDLSDIVRRLEAVEHTISGMQNGGV